MFKVQFFPSISKNENCKYNNPLLNRFFDSDVIITKLSRIVTINNIKINLMLFIYLYVICITQFVFICITQESNKSTFFCVKVKLFFISNVKS